MTIETANRLYDLRKKHGLSQEELAEKLGVSRQAVSKWERSEASPDTDNLIALAKIYGLSLDELIFGEKQSDATEGEAAEKSENTEDYDHIEVGPTSIRVESNDGDKVKIDLNGILVKSENGDKVKVGLNGIKIECADDDDDDDDDDDEEDRELKENYPKSRIWLELPYPIICVVAYLLFGFLDICGGWALSWIIFITIPIYYSLIHAIFKKSLSEFVYPVFTAFAYLFMGLYFNNWHPSWIIFITIPIYYPIANAIDRKIRERAQAKAKQ